MSIAATLNDDTRTKRCKRCGKEKLIRHFKKRVRTQVAKHTGEVYATTSYESHCNTCDGERMKDRLARRDV